MTLVNQIPIIAQNLFLNVAFYGSFLLYSFFFTGFGLPLFVAFLLALITSLSYRLIYNKTLPVPRKSAVFITGCSTGIGFDAAKRLVALGFMTFATVRQAEAGEKLRKACNNSSLCIPVLCDVTKDEDVRKAVETVKAKMAVEGRKLYALINNAGYHEATPIELAQSDSIKKQFETNVYAVISVTQYFLPLLREFASPSQAARIINVSSVVGEVSVPGGGLYCASKHALEAITDSLRIELSPWNISVSSLQPGVIGTNFYSTVSAVDEANTVKCQKLLTEGKLLCGGAVLERYLTSLKKVAASMKKLPFESPSFTTDAIEMALRDSRPLPRYRAAYTSVASLIIESMPKEALTFLLGRDWR